MKYCGPSSNVMKTARLAGLALVAIHDLVGYRYVAESVGLVQAGDGLLVAPQQRPAIAAAAELQQRSAHQEHALADGFGPEILVALNVDQHQLVALAGVDEIVDRRLIVDDALRFELDFGIEITLRLKVVPQVALAFEQQGIVHACALRKRAPGSAACLAKPWRPRRAPRTSRSGVDIQRRLCCDWYRNRNPSTFKVTPRLKAPAPFVPGAHILDAPCARATG